MKKHFLNDSAGYLIRQKTFPHGKHRQALYWNCFVLFWVWSGYAVLYAQPLAPHLTYTDAPAWLFGEQYRDIWTTSVAIQRIDPSVAPLTVLRGDLQRKDGVWVHNSTTGQFFRLWPIKPDLARYPFGGFLAAHLAETLGLTASGFEFRRWWGRPAIWEQAQPGDEVRALSADTLLQYFHDKRLVGGVEVFQYATFRVLGMLLGSPEASPQTWRPTGEEGRRVYAPVWSPFLGMTRYDGLINQAMALHDSRMRRPKFNGKAEDLTEFIAANASDIAFLADWGPENWALLTAFIKERLQPEVIRQAALKIPTTLDATGRNEQADILVSRMQHLQRMIASFGQAIRKARKGTYRKPFTILSPYGETNPTDWVLGGFSIQRVIRGYHPVYGRAYQVTTDVSPITGGFNLWGNAHIPHIWKKWGLFTEAHALCPTNSHSFYKLGNESPKTEKRYYDAQRQRFRVWLAIDRSSAHLKHRLRVGPFWEYTHLGEVRINGSADMDVLSDVYADRKYWGWEARFQTDFTDHPTFPTKGMRSLVQVRHHENINQKDEIFTTFLGESSFYIPFSFVPGLLAVRLGGGHIFGDFPYYAAHRMGQLNYLRGYFQRRFGGRSMAFTNIEARSELFRRTFFGQRLTSGWLTFADAGRVWATGETSNRLHVGYGVGGWTKAGNMVVSGWVAFSDEYPRGLPMARLCVQF